MTEHCVALSAHIEILARREIQQMYAPVQTYDWTPSGEFRYAPHRTATELGASGDGEILLLDDFVVATIPPEAEQLRMQIREFLAARLAGVSSDRRARSWMGFDADFTRLLAAKGWLGITLPRLYGGGGQSQFARFVLVEELLGVGAPVAAHWIADRQSAPLILRFGTEEQRRLYLPRICRGEAFFCIGMSEAGSGSDLASIRSRAVKTSDGWRLTGTKLWTTHAQRSHFMIALVRTSEASQRRDGLSQFVIDLKLPGITIRPPTSMTVVFDPRYFIMSSVEPVARIRSSLVANAATKERRSSWIAMRPFTSRQSASTGSPLVAPPVIIPHPSAV